LGPKRGIPAKIKTSFSNQIHSDLELSIGSTFDNKGAAGGEYY
jgi:hypothetical protein